MICYEEDKKLFWAKSDPYKTLEAHAIETAAVTYSLLQSGCYVPLRRELEKALQLDCENVISLACYLASLHDIAKIHYSFLEKARLPEIDSFLDRFEENHFEGYRHEMVGFYMLSNLWKEMGLARTTAKSLAYAIRFHHQKKSRFDGLKCYRGTEEEWKTYQRQFEEKMRLFFKPDLEDIERFDQNRVCSLLLGILVTSDWIASGTCFEHLAWQSDISVHFRAASSVSERFLQDNNMQYLAFQEVNHISELFPFISENTIRPLQKAIEVFFETCKTPPLAMVIEAPMGEGKTEAALFAAEKLGKMWGKSGYYVALPTAATSNQMYGRVNELLKRKKNGTAKLLHATAWMVEHDGSELFGGQQPEALKWTDPVKRGLIAPYAVGTVDQVMMSVLQVKYGILRLTGLASKVLIIDEIHAYDSYMTDIICLLLSWCRHLHIPVILLSATLPPKRKAELLEPYGTLELSDAPTYPGITVLYENQAPEEIAVHGTFMSQTVEVERVPFLNQHDEIAKWTHEFLEQNGGCVCVIVNTVSAAQLVYEALCHYEKKVMLFHAQFTMKRRCEIEKECIRLFGKDKTFRPKRAVLIATQVVEQSLDLDFDYMILEICPIDLILQRMGRLWRHTDTKRPETVTKPRITVLLPKDDSFGASGHVYSPYILQETQTVLSDTNKIQIPDDIPKLVRQVYESKEDMKWYEYMIGEQVSAGSAKIYEITQPTEPSFYLSSSDLTELFEDADDSDMRAETRLGEDSVRIALLPDTLYETVKSGKKLSHEIANEILSYSMSIRQKRIAPYLNDAIKGNGLLAGLYCFHANGSCVQMADGTGLIMDEKKGFLVKGAENGV